MIQQLLAQQQMPGAQGAVWRPPDHPAWYERLMGAPPQLAEKIPPGYARQPPINFGEASQLPPPSAGMNALPETPSPPPQLIEKVPPGYQRRLPQPPAVNEPVQLPPPPRGINQPPPAGQRPMPSTQRYEQMLGARPELPTPRLWQRIAAGAVGGLGGYVNAAGRTRIDPEAINQAATNIQYPGYGAKMEAWRSDVELAKEQAAIEQQRADREMKQQQMESEIAARAAQAEADLALAKSRGQETKMKGSVQTFTDESTGDVTIVTVDPTTGAQIGQAQLIKGAGKKVSSTDTPRGSVQTFTDETTGDVTIVTINPQTGEQIGTPQTIKGAGKKRPPAEPREPAGSFQAILDDKGNITGYYNPAKGVSAPPPPGGGRRTPVSAAQQQREVAIDVMLENIDRLETLAKKHPGYIGPVVGRATGTVRGIIGVPGSSGEDATEVNDMFQISDDLADQLLRARSGAQINEREFARLRALVPDPRGSYEKFMSDLGRFRQNLQDTKRGLSGSSARPQMGPSNIPPPTARAVKMKSPKGKVYEISDPSEIDQARKRGWTEVR